MKEQGCLIDCVYCKYIRPDLQGKSLCPKCHGVTPYFQPSRMMDKTSASKMILSGLINNPNQMKLNEEQDFLLNLLKNIEIYSFNLKDAIIQQLRDLETIE